LWRMGDFERLTPEAIDQVWVRLKAGRRRSRPRVSWWLCTSTAREYLMPAAGSCRRLDDGHHVGCRWWNGRRLPVGSRRGARSVDRDGVGSGAVDPQPGDRP